MMLWYVVLGVEQLDRSYDLNREDTEGKVPQ
jgi:hypothetical protein